MKKIAILAVVSIYVCGLTGLEAQDAAPAPPADTTNTISSPTDTRHGWFNWLDSRSAYGQGVFPEPFLVDDSDLEVNEARLDWQHTEGSFQQNDVVTAEIEKGFGLTTLEVEVPYERDAVGDVVTRGFDNVDLGARRPFYQFVSAGGFVDTTTGAGIEVGIPVNSALSKNAELVPKIFDDLRLGRHFTMQSILGWSKLYGSGDDGGLETFEYGFDFGWTFQHSDLPLPGVQQLIPILELSGETELNKDDPGHNSLLANLAMRANLDTIGGIQPRLGFGVLLPVDYGARQDQHWGIFTSLVFEY
jgi:hypothetical protein